MGTAGAGLNVAPMVLVSNLHKATYANFMAKQETQGQEHHQHQQHNHQQQHGDATEHKINISMSGSTSVSSAGAGAGAGAGAAGVSIRASGAKDGCSSLTGPGFVVVVLSLLFYIVSFSW